MGIIKYYVKKYPFISMIISMMSATLIVECIFLLLIFLSIHELLVVFTPNCNIELCLCSVIPIFILWIFISQFVVTFVFDYILKNVSSGITYKFIKVLHDSTIAKILYILAFVLIVHPNFDLNQYEILAYYIMPYLILFLYWYLTDIMAQLNPDNLKNCFEKIIYRILNKTKNIWVNSLSFINKLRIKLFELGFIKKSKTFILTKAQIPTFICVNILCSGYFIYYTLYLCWCKFANITNENMWFLFILILIALVYFFVRFIILPRTYDAIIKNSNSGMIRNFVYKLKTDESLRILTALFIFVVDIFSIKYLYCNSNLHKWYCSDIKFFPFFNTDIIHKNIISSYIFHIIITIIFWGYTPIYLILYYHWDMKEK